MIFIDEDESVSTTTVCLKLTFNQNAVELKRITVTGPGER